MTVSRILLAALVVGASATAAILLNLLLLGNVSAERGPVGTLTPRANLPQAPQWTIRPANGRGESDRADD